MVNQPAGSGPPRDPRSGRGDDAAASARRVESSTSNQYWPDHASTAQHLADLAEQRWPPAGTRSTSSAAGGATSRAPSVRRRMRSTTGSDPPGRPATAFGRRTTLAPDGGLPQLLPPGLPRRALPAAVRRGLDPDHAADHRPGRDGPPPLQKGRATSSGAWTSTPTPASPWAG